MENQKKKGLLALLGIGAGVFAWWKYKNLSAAEKDELRAKANDAGKKIKDTVHDVSDRMKDAANDVENTVKDKYDQLKHMTEKKADEMN